MSELDQLKKNASSKISNLGWFFPQNKDFVQNSPNLQHSLQKHQIKESYCGKKTTKSSSVGQFPGNPKKRPTMHGKNSISWWLITSNRPMYFKSLPFPKFNGWITSKMMDLGPSSASPIPFWCHVSGEPATLGRLTAGTYSHHPWKERKMIWTKPPWLCYVPC